MVTPLERQQVDRVIALLRDALGDSLLGVYLYGSAVAGGWYVTGVLADPFVNANDLSM